MKIEVLYPEICCLFGDKANMRYFEMCLPEAEFIKTPVCQMPRFLTEDVDMVYFGSCTESNQEKILERFKGYQGRINELIDKGVIFLMTGNSFEIMGKYISDSDGKKIEALGIFDFYSERTIPDRHNSLVLGEYNAMKIVGSVSRFSHSYGIKDEGFINVKKGYGSSKESAIEGIRRKNLFGTYLLGPLLILNPDFTKHLMKLLGVENPVLAYEKEIYKAYDVRLKEFESDIKY